MAIPKKVAEYLKKAKKKFEALEHKTVYTAYDLAQTLRKNLHEIAKALVVKADGIYAIVIVPASHRLHLGQLKKVLKAKKISIPDEKIMVKIFKVKPGALSAFGKFHNVPTFIDKSLLKTQQAIFQAGSFTDSVRMSVKDFIEMEKATVANFAKKAQYRIQKAVNAPKKKGKQKKK